MHAVIFDFDGTLADSFESVMAIAYKLTRREQLADINHVTSMRDNNMGLRQAIEILEIPRWQWPWLLNRGRQIMSKEVERIPLFPGIGKTLDELHKKGFSLFIISSNSRTNVYKFLKEKEIIQYFKKVYGGVGLFDKSRVIKRVLKENKLSVSNVIYVGDEVRDIEAAKKTNIPIIAVTWGYNSEKLLNRHNPTIIARSPSQLGKAILEWGNVG